MMDELIKESERLWFRSLVVSDAIKLYEMYADKEAMKHRGSKPMENVHDAHEMISNQYVLTEHLKKHRFGIVEKSSHTLVGTLLISSQTKTPSLYEIGFSFDKNYWRKGYAQETIQILMDSFRTSSVCIELTAWVKKENIASIRLFEKMGFTKKNQTEHPDSYWYTLALKA